MLFIYIYICCLTLNQKQYGQKTLQQQQQQQLSWLFLVRTSRRLLSCKPVGHAKLHERQRIVGEIKAHQRKLHLIRLCRCSMCIMSNFPSWASNLWGQHWSKFQSCRGIQGLGREEQEHTAACSILCEQIPDESSQHSDQEWRWTFVRIVS